jgi:hypothetical protein
MMEKKERGTNVVVPSQSFDQVKSVSIGDEHLPAIGEEEVVRAIDPVLCKPDQDDPKISG